MASYLYLESKAFQLYAVGIQGNSWARKHKPVYPVLKIALFKAWIFTHEPQKKTNIYPR